MLTPTTPAAAVVQQQPPCANPLCKVCRMAPGIVAQHQAEAKGLRQRGYEMQARQHDERVRFWQNRLKEHGHG